MVTRILANRSITAQPRIFLKSQQASKICHITDHIMIEPVLVNHIPQKQEQTALHCLTSWFVVVGLHIKHQGIARVFSYILLKMLLFLLLGLFMSLWFKKINKAEELVEDSSIF